MSEINDYVENNILSEIFMAKENGAPEEIIDTRLELHILEYNVRMVTITKDTIANYTHYLIKIALLPNSR